jgi:large subunit ribosomal protein L17
MRHRKSIRKLGVKTNHRKAMMSNMATSLFDQGQIKTTVARAKALVPVVARLVTLAKRGDLHARRLAGQTIKDKSVLKKLFAEVAPEFEKRNGGYARIVRAGFRQGDGASMAVVQLLIEKKVEEKTAKKGKAKTKKQEKAEEK